MPANRRTTRPLGPASSARFEKEIDEVERELVRLRDELIIQCRRQGDPVGVSERGQTRLGQINVALSLVVAVEYPVTSIQRTALEQARDVLKNC
jgi:hypothetical protein